ncbi:uncharacterized protein [Narcine bancroftii]|uniref:uncharacterized protein isoform X2 n=1 Tax=Narcine bancroftii TaxID=1343680 RepID=UPI0038310EBB
MHFEFKPLLYIKKGECKGSRCGLTRRWERCFQGWCWVYGVNSMEKVKFRPSSSECEVERKGKERNALNLFHITVGSLHIPAKNMQHACGM